MRAQAASAGAGPKAEAGLAVSSSRQLGVSPPLRSRNHRRSLPKKGTRSGRMARRRIDCTPRPAYCAPLLSLLPIAENLRCPWLPRCRPQLRVPSTMPSVRALQFRPATVRRPAVRSSWQGPRALRDGREPDPVPEPVPELLPELVPDPVLEGLIAAPSGADSGSSIRGSATRIGRSL
jgi:hypothetical protein